MGEKGKGGEWRVGERKGENWQVRNSIFKKCVLSSFAKRLAAGGSEFHAAGTAYENVLSPNADGELCRTAVDTGYHLVRSPTGKCICLLYTSPSPRDRQKSRMPSSA